MKIFFRMALITIGLVFFIGSCSMLPLETDSPPNQVVSPTFTPFQPLLTPEFTGVSQPEPIEPPPAEVEPEDQIEAEQALQTLEEPSPIQTNQPPPPSLWISSALPPMLQENANIPPGFQKALSRDEASVYLEVGDGLRLSQWVYVLVAPFPTAADGITSDRLKGFWQGEADSLLSGSPLILDESTFHVFSSQWGEPAADRVKVMPAANLLNYAWENRPTWAVVPFEALDPRWKVLEVDGLSPIRKGFNPDSYPLTFSYSLTSDIYDEGTLNQLSGYLSLPHKNYDPEKKTTLAMTGVTAMVRCTANTMDRFGITYPAEEIGDLLRGADLTHISNEIPFATGCPPQRCIQEGLIFCSHPKYIELMEYIGTNIVELTGDHFADWGDEAMYFTLQMYRERGWPYYGGGENLEEGRQALLIEHNGNRLAFIGCNGKSLAGYATASATRPGAVRCDYPWMHAEIARLTSEGYLVISTFQHEEYYRYDVPQNMRQDFLSMAEAGAVIVSGSQAHQPHGMEFLESSFVHYGLGNLFFDQWGFCPGRACDYAFIDIHVFYNGRHISTELFPIQFVDYARTRFMTSEEKENFLNNIIFKASGW
jgi:hypothetical protein